MIRCGARDYTCTGMYMPYEEEDQYQACMLWYEDTCCVLSQWTSSLVRRPLDPGIIRTSDSGTNMVTVSRHLETLELTACNQLGDLAWIHDVCDVVLCIRKEAWCSTRRHSAKQETCCGTRSHSTRHACMLWYEDTWCVLSPWTSSLVRRPCRP